MKQKLQIFAVLFLAFHVSTNAQFPFGKLRKEKEKQTLLNTRTLFQQNYSSFSYEETKKITSTEMLEMNKGYELHPELGLIGDAPCIDCYEILSKRTETSKTYAKNGTLGSHFFLRNANEPMHYKDAKNQWLTIPKKMTKESDGIFKVFSLQSPITINAKEGFVKIGEESEEVIFNQEINLIYINPKGKEQNLGKMSWSNFTAGDDGVHIINAWNGIDINLTLYQGRIKTDYIIKNALPQYASGHLVIREKIKLAPDLKLNQLKESEMSEGSQFNIKNSNKEIIYTISPAIAFENNNFETSMITLPYQQVKEDVLEILLAGKYLNLPLASYPFVVDPLFSSTNSLGARTMGTKNGGTTDPCNYTNNVPVPDKVTITDVKFKFGYQINISQLRANDVAFSVGLLGADGVECATGRLACAAVDANTGLTVSQCYTANYFSVHEDIKKCYPAPKCPSYTLPLVLHFYRMKGAVLTCSDMSLAFNYLPFEVVVEGRTLELNSPILHIPSSSYGKVCRGDSIELQVNPEFGVPPYSAVWTPGNLPGLTVMVSPTELTTYTVTITDACGNVVSATTEIKVIEPSESEEKMVVCNAELPLSWNGITITEPGVHKYVTENAVGCDSTVTLYLDLEDVMRDTVILRGCSPITYKGKTYNTSTEVFNIYKSVNNCDSIFQILMIEINPIDLWLPNAFSPNGDGLNDEFGPVSSGEEVLGYSLSIFNRWGGLVFTSSKIGDKWDGSHGGKPADIGTYFYVLKGKCNDGTPVEYKGDFSLIR